MLSVVSLVIGFTRKSATQIWYKLPYLVKKLYFHAWREIHFTKRANITRLHSKKLPFICLKPLSFGESNSKCYLPQVWRQHWRSISSHACTAMNVHPVQKSPVKSTSQVIPREGRNDDRKIAIQGMKFNVLNSAVSSIMGNKEEERSTYLGNSLQKIEATTQIIARSFTGIPVVYSFPPL